MDTDTLWQILAVASFAALLVAAGVLIGWALYRNGRRDEAIARDEDDAWWDANVRREPRTEPPPELAVVAGVTPLPRRVPAETRVGGWIPPEKRDYPPGLTTAAAAGLDEDADGSPAVAAGEVDAAVTAAISEGRRS